MTGLSALVASLGALSLVVTKVIDLIRNATDPGDLAHKWCWNVAAFAVGLAFALGWQVNLAGQVLHLVPALASSTHLTGIWGQVLTGIAIGGGSGFFHELLDALSGIATKTQGA